MKRRNIVVFILLLLFVEGTVFAQKRQNASSALERPKLVVGIVIDQMRWDYLYRYYNKYENGGFKRLLNDGFSCENTFLNYIPSVTAIGHSCIFTGSVPSLHGIAGNSWIDSRTGKTIYCVSDPTVKTVGASDRAGEMSPRNLLATTITDELRLATNFESKVVGVSLKDRAAILPSGHNPTAAFWIDNPSGNFITSSYYMPELPEWVKAFNEQKLIQQFVDGGWNTLLPIGEYTESSSDDVLWEGILKGAERPVFPYNLKRAYEKDHGSFEQTPFGNTLTLRFAEAAVNGYELGQGKSTDFLTINCASTDYVGHLVGPNAIEQEDVFLRLDRDLAKFFSFLDQKVGKGNYLVFLTADHGAAQAEGFMEANKMPTGFLDEEAEKGLESSLDQQFGADHLVWGVSSFQVFFNESKIDSLHLDREKIKAAAVSFLQRQKGILYAADQDKISQESIPQPIREMMINGYNHQRSGSVVMVPQSGWLPSDCQRGTSHSLWNPYDTHIPLIFMGWKIKHGTTNRTVHVTDISATVAALLHVQMPSGCIGTPVTEVTNK